MLALCLVPALTGCNSYLFSNRDAREAVDFNTHPSILRGTFSGTFDGGADTGKVLTLTLTPTYSTPEEYKVTAVGTLGTEAVTGAGIVNGGGTYKYIQAQTSPTMMAMTKFTLTRADGSETAWNCAFSSPTALYCSFPSGRVSLTKQS